MILKQNGDEIRDLKYAGNAGCPKQPYGLLVRN